MTSQCLFARARAIARYHPDNTWRLFYRDGVTNETWWETSPANPAVTVIVIESLKRELRIPWPDALEAVNQLFRNPEPPEPRQPGKPVTEGDL